MLLSLSLCWISRENLVHAHNALWDVATDTSELNTGHLPNGTAAEAHVKKIRLAGEFGGELEILVLARILDVTFCSVRRLLCGFFSRLTRLPVPVRPRFRIPWVWLPAIGARSVSAVVRSSIPQSLEGKQSCGSQSIPPSTLEGSVKRGVSIGKLSSSVRRPKKAVKTVDMPPPCPILSSVQSLTVRRYL